jgi:hypothetical protein
LKKIHELEMRSLDDEIEETSDGDEIWNCTVVRTFVKNFGAFKD